eukprot:tig00021318_g20191.t1
MEAPRTPPHSHDALGLLGLARANEGSPTSAFTPTKANVRQRRPVPDGEAAAQDDMLPSPRRAISDHEGPLPDAPPRSAVFDACPPPSSEPEEIPREPPQIERARLLKQALSHVKKKLMPKSYRVHFLLGLALLRLGEYQRAQNEFEGAARILQKRNADRPAHLARCINLSVVCAMAARFADPAAEIDPEALQARFVEAIGLDGSQKDIWNNCGLLHIAIDNPEAARKVFQPFLSLNAEYTDAVNNIALAYLEHDPPQLDAAEACLQGAIFRDRGHQEALSNYGVALLKRRQFALAAQIFERAIALDAGPAHLHVNLGCALVGMGSRHWPQAGRAFQEALRRSPEDPAVRLNLGKWYVLAVTLAGASTAAELREACASAATEMLAPLTEDDATRADANLHRANLDAAGDEEAVESSAASAREAVAAALEADPADAAAWVELGLLEFAEGNNEDAHDRFKQALRHDIKCSAAWSNLGIATQLLGRVDETQELYERARLTGGESAPLLNNMGNLFRQRQQFAEAQLAYQRAIELDPEFAEAYNNMALLYICKGQWASADQCLARAIQIDPQFDCARSNRMKLARYLAREGKTLASASGSASS